MAEKMEILFDEAEVSQRIHDMAAEVIERYKDKRPLFVCLLRGGVQFGSLLMFEITKLDPEFHPETEYLKVVTYGHGRKAQAPKIIPLFDADTVQGRNIVLVDDVLDTGATPFAVEQFVRDLGARDIDLVVLSQKQREREYWQEATIYGFKTPDVWLAGMGCDDAAVAPEAYRWAPYIGAVITE